MTDKMRIVTIALAAALVGAGLMAGFYVIGSVGATASPTTQTRTYSGTGGATILDTDKIASGNYTLTFTANNYAQVTVAGENEWETGYKGMGHSSSHTGGSENITKGFVFWDGPRRMWYPRPDDYHHLPAGELFIWVGTQPAAEWTLTIAPESPADNSESADPTPAPTLTPTATPPPAPTPTIRPTNTPARGTPTISGTAQVGETLTANTSGIADADGLDNVSFSYRWLADDADISGATGVTYTLADDDEGKVIEVTVSFTDDAGNGETLTSAATDAVAAAEPTEPPDKPRGLSAAASNGQVVLTWDDPQDDSITGYVILRRVRVNDTGGDFSVLVADTGTAATTYTDSTVAASTTYTYRIKAINGAGTSERSRWFHIDTLAAPDPAGSS